MAVPESFVVVQKSLFDRLRRHCEHCPDFSEQSEASGKRRRLGASEPALPEPALPPKPRERKNESADWFVRNVPKANEWRNRQIELRLHTEQQYEEVVRAFTGRTNVGFKRERCEEDKESEDELVDLAEKFSLLTKSSLSNANLQRSFANFQALVFLSYCLVLRKRGVPYEAVDRKIQHITDAREVDRRKLLDSAQLINDIIIDLTNHGWTISRATELFFITAFSLTNLIRIGDGETLQPIIERLKSAEFVKHDYGDCLRPEYSIPGLIKCLLDANNITTSRLSIDEICADLGYNKDDVKSIGNIFKVHAASKSTRITSVNLNFNVLVPGSFQSNDRPRSSESNSCSAIAVSEHRNRTFADYPPESPSSRPDYTEPSFRYYSPQAEANVAAHGSSQQMPPYPSPQRQQPMSTICGTISSLGQLQINNSVNWCSTVVNPQDELLRNQSQTPLANGASKRKADRDRREAPHGKQQDLPPSSPMGVPQGRLLPTPQPSQEPRPSAEQQLSPITDTHERALRGDPAPNSPPHVSITYVSSRSPSPLRTQQTRLLPTPLSSTVSENPFIEWNEVEDILRGDCIQDTGYLILLLYALGGSLIPELMFLRVQLPQARWNDSGAKCRVTGPEAGLEQRLVDILSDADRAIQTIQALELFVKSSTINGSRAFSLVSQFQIRISQFLNDQEKEKWSIKALKWVCFVFPRDELWEPHPSYASVVRGLLPLLNCALRAVKRSSMPNCLREEVAGALLAASRVGQVRRSVLSTVAELVDNASPLHLQAEMAHQQSILLRLNANFDHSERVIHDFCCRCGYYNQRCMPSFYQQFQPDRVSKRLNALYGQLHRSHLENLVQCDEYKLAIQEVDNWQYPESPSLIETRVLPSRTVTVCKIFRSQGMFPDARERLELCLMILHPQETNRSQVLCNLADVYCDLTLPEKAEELIGPEVERERKEVTKAKALRRFLVSAIDVYIQRRLYDDASTTINELEGVFGGLHNLDISDQLLHFLEAIQRWEVALHHVRNYGSFEGEGFTYAVVHLSKSLAYLKVGERGEARASFDRGKEILHGRIRDYWIPTLAAWAEDVLPKIQSMTGWVITDTNSI